LMAVGAGSSCDSFCAYRMNADSFCCGAMPNGCGCSPYHLKCFNASGVTPLNRRRVAFQSQDGTNEIDPSIPQMTPFTNVTACLRMLHFQNRDAI